MRDIILSRCIEHLTINWTDRMNTTEVDKDLPPQRWAESAPNNFTKCARDLGYIYDALMKDINDKTTSNITHIANQFWYNDERQIKSYNAELDTYDFLCNIMSEKLNDDDKDHLENCILLLKNIVENGPTNKVYNNLQFLATKRKNWKPLTGEMKKTDLDLIIRASSGLTPALSNEYNYRVDLVPDKHKETILNETGQVSQAALEADKPGYAQDYNPNISTRSFAILHKRRCR